MLCSIWNHMPMLVTGKTFQHHSVQICSFCHLWVEVLFCLAVFHSLKGLRFPFQMLQSHVLKIRNPKPSFVVQPSICISSGLCVTLGYIQWHLHVYLLSEWTLKADSLLLSRLMPQCFPWHLYTVSFSAASPRWTDKHSQWCSNFTVVAFFDLWYCRACLGRAVEESSLYEMS